MRITSELSLCGTTLWAPETVETPAEAVAAGRLSAEEAEELALDHVPVAPDELSPPDMAVHAARQALDAAGTDAADLGLLVHCCIWHQGHEMWSAPHYVARRLGAEHALPVTMSQGCNAVMPALELAAGRMLADDEVTAALVTAADRFVLPNFDRWNGSYACAHGDAATATVLRRGSHPGRGVLLRAVNSVAVPELEEMNRAGLELTPGPLAHGEKLDLRRTKKAYLQQYGFESFEKLARGAIVAVLRRTLEEAGVEPDDPRITCVTMPRMSRKIVRGTYFPVIAEVTPAPPLGLAARTGHLSCSDILANLADMTALALRKPGDIGLVLNAGGGYTWSAIAVEVPGR
ncbi:ketoacyl-ACP synthase III family protein [Streptomyces sp. NPDC001668]|uniref:ketoacyl-ACP synthase III family protein n=1 Tax=unclassified Streptomyces TaxID=2593676 RepID=UPI0033FA224D